MLVLEAIVAAAKKRGNEIWGGVLIVVFILFL